MTFRQLELKFTSIFEALQGGICNIHSEYVKDYIFWNHKHIIIFREKTVYGPSTQHFVIGNNLVEADTDICGCFEVNKDIYVWDHQGCVFKLEIPGLENELPVWRIQKIFYMNNLMHLKSFKDKVAVVVCSDSNLTLKLYPFGHKWWESADLLKILPGQVKEMHYGCTKLKLSFLKYHFDASADTSREVILLNYGQQLDMLYLEDKSKNIYSVYKTEVCNISSVYCMEDGVAIVLNNFAVIWVTGSTYTEYLHIVALPCEPKSLVFGLNMMLCTDGINLWRCRPERKLVTERFRSYFIWFMSSYKIPIYGASSVIQILGCRHAFVITEYGDFYMIDFTKVIDDDMTVVGRISGRFSGNWHKNCQTWPKKSDTSVFNFDETAHLLRKCKFYEKKWMLLKEKIIDEEDKLVGLNFISIRNFFTPGFQTLFHIDKVFPDVTTTSKIDFKDEYRLVVKVTNTNQEDYSPVEFQFYTILKVSGTLTYSATTPAILKKGCFARTSISFIMNDFSVMPEFQCFIVLDSRKYDLTFRIPLMKQTLDISYFMSFSSYSLSFKYSAQNAQVSSSEEKSVCLPQNILKHYFLKVPSIKEFNNYLHHISNMDQERKECQHFLKQVDMKGDAKIATFQHDENIGHISSHRTTCHRSHRITQKPLAKTYSSSLDNHSHILLMNESSLCGISSLSKNQVDVEQEADFFRQRSKVLNACDMQLKTEKKEDSLRKSDSQEFSDDDNFRKDENKIQEFGTPVCLCVGSVFIYMMYAAPNIIDISSKDVRMLHIIKDYFLKHMFTSASLNVCVRPSHCREILHSCGSYKKYTLLEIEALHKKFRKLVNDIHLPAVG